MVGFESLGGGLIRWFHWRCCQGILEADSVPGLRTHARAHAGRLARLRTRCKRNDPVGWLWILYSTRFEMGLLRAWRCTAQPPSAGPSGLVAEHIVSGWPGSGAHDKCIRAWWRLRVEIFDAVVHGRDGGGWNCRFRTCSRLLMWPC